MRPHLLTIKAFGPFAEQVTVDFDRMENGVFLICGETGSGKTSIFDAMMYALYGTASGTDRDGLNAVDYYCDLCGRMSSKPEMRVELTFSNGGRTFTVLRRRYWGIKGTSKESRPESSLREGEALLASDEKSERTSKVTEKVTELLGMDVNQFRRIIMLAQGEFQRFLESKPDERARILGRLYDNGRHIDLEERLRAASLQLNGRMKDNSLMMSETVKRFITNRELSEEEKLFLNHEHPEVLSLFDKLIGEMTEEQTCLSGEIGRMDNELEEMNNRRGQAEADNKVLNEKKKAEQLLRAEEEKTEHFETLREELHQAEKAEELLPLEERAAEERDNLKQAETKVAALTEKQKMAEEESERTEQLERNCEKEFLPKTEAAAAEKTRLEEKLPVYGKLAAARENAKNADGERRNAETAAEHLKTELEDKHREADELDTRLKALTEAGDAAVKNAENEEKRILERRNDLNSLKEQLEKVKRLDTDFRNAEKCWEEAGNVCQEQLELYNELHRRFISGQAGVLALELKKTIAEKGEGRCPVCGLVHHAVGAFADEQQNVPTQKQLDEQYERFRIEKNKEDAAAQRRTKAESDYRNAREALLESARKLLHTEEEKLSGLWELTDAALRTEDGSLAAARQNLEREREAADEKKKKTERKEKISSELTELSQHLDKAKEKVNDAGIKAAENNRTVRELCGQLEGFPATEEDAHKKMNDLCGLIDLLNGKMEKAKKAHEDAEQNLSGIRGRLSEAKQSLEKQQETVKNTEEIFTDALESSIFRELAAYRAALIHEGHVMTRTELKNWMDKGKKSLEAHRETLSGLRKSMDTLCRQSEGKTETDLGALDGTIAALKNRRKESIDKKERLSADLKQNGSARSELAGLIEKRSMYGKAEELLRTMADPGRGGTRFSSYVLMEFFHRIVERANEHLCGINGGEYLLTVPQSENDHELEKLELKIDSVFTDTTRDRKSLSGGQKFGTSLALALGLSDVVQHQRTGKIRIDSMFIDEGFGSLDSSSLEKALGVLNTISGEERQIGIISHVDQLKELPRQIVVTGDRRNGSRISYVTDR